ncbi:MAG: enoyl-CoA hydratase-related protein [Sneathiella sp.]
MMKFETLDFDRYDAVAVIRMNRPDNANSLNKTMGQELMDVAIECDENPDIRSVIYTGAGRFFSAGGDLSSFADAGENTPKLLKELTIYLHAALSRFARMDAPVITAVNGIAAGAGFSMACSGDLSIASEEAKFTMAYTNAGLVPDGSSTHYVARHIGLRRTQELMLTNRVLTAEEALDWGLINKVVPVGAVMDEAMTLAATLSQGPTRTYGFVKDLLLQTFNGSLETQMELEARGIAAAANTHDGKEGIQAFLEKRKPVFTGR